MSRHLNSASNAENRAHLFIAIRVVIHDVPPPARHLVEHDSFLRSNSRSGKVASEGTRASVRLGDEVAMVGPD